MNLNAEPRPGALRRVENGRVVAMANPRDALYSTVSMVANERYDMERAEWVAIYPDEEDGEQ